MIRRTLGGALACLVATLALAQPRPVQVLRVIDGDSLIIAGKGGAGVDVRLQGIDAPEACQAWGREARAALEERLRGSSVTWSTRGQDAHGRQLATLWTDGDELNAWLVVEGHAWSSRYKWDRGPYVKQERVAAALSRGLHATSGAVQPAEFRRSRGACGAAAPDSPSLPPAATPRPTPVQTSLRCDGRTHCSQMTSCAEATYFLRHCPGVKMDGNRDGVPCEKQWCR